MASVSSAVDGLVSGLDTASIITSLMQVDAASQTQLKSNVSTLQSKVTGYQSVNTKMSALQTAAETLTKAATWAAPKATSTSAGATATGVTATASSSALPGSLSVYVDQLAAARSVLTKPITSAEAASSSAGTKLGLPMDVLDGNGAYVGTIQSAGTLDEVAASINKMAGTGITAVAVRVGTDQYRLQITATKTGEKDGKFSLVPVGSTDPTDETGITELTPASNARLYITPGETGTTSAIPVFSSTNTFTDLMKGVTATVTSKGAATVTVARDNDAVTTAVKNLVDAANGALTEIAKQSKAGVAGTDGKVTGSGALNGDSTLRSLKSQILATVTTALGGTTSASKYGIQTTRDGALTFNADTFKKAYAADPATTQKLLAPTSVDSTTKATSLAENLLAVAKGATSRTGSLTTVISGENNTISSLQDKIADWDVRLALRKERYQSYYSNLEVALGKLQSQSTWLSGQLSSLG